MAVPRLTVLDVTAERWKDFEALFEARGGPKYCWCMEWRAIEQGRRADSARRKDAMASCIEKGVPVGLLGYLEAQPVAWCSIAPRSTYRRLVNDGSCDDGIWSIACFFVAREYRGTGITRRMLAAAIRHARKNGAKVVEAYPVDEDSPSYRFMGFVSLFEQAGFCEIGREGTRRHVMQRQLRR
ncbi:MAG TPA: GNAT family N-acetyltransferase [Povalibacter sp.]